MRIVEKPWYFRLQLFWYSMPTVIGDTLYYPKENVPDQSTIQHCKHHSKQQVKNGVLWHWIKYLFFFPIIKNQYRWDCEFEAYIEQVSRKETVKRLTSYQYGWLRESLHV